MAVDSSVVDASDFNPLASNRFETRGDVVSACHGLFNPLRPHFSPGKARVQLDASTSTWDRAACDLEGWARPLFGIAPLVAGGGDFEHWALYREGLKNGTNPTHPEYWGKVDDMDQRHVEATALGYALILAPQHFWQPLDERTQKNVAAWLITSRDGTHAGNNHMFFRVLVDLGLRNVGIETDLAMTEEYLDRLENLYIGDGWYRDGDGEGDTRRIDYYNPFAMHYYGLLYAKYGPDKARGERFKDRARRFAAHYQHWFADTGANVPYGRSLTYRHCVAAFWGALALVDVEALPWGVMKGLYLRNMRWWATQPISRYKDGLLTLGYSYPNQYMCERYSSTGSPWWSMKAFLPLALPAEHPFWAADEVAVSRPATAVFSIPGMIFTHQSGHTVLTVSGPGTGQQMRGVPEKYSKFAYSSRYGFSVESDALGFKTGAFDSMIAFSDDNIHYRVREHCEEAHMSGDGIFSTWYPWKDVKVETWLIPSSKWHIRIHRVTSSRDLRAIEGGFAAPRTDFNADTRDTKDSAAYVLSKLGDFSGILDDSEPRRTAKINAPHGNTNVMFPRTWVPQLLGDVHGGVSTVFRCAVLAAPHGESAQKDWQNPPEIPDVDDLEEEFRSRSVQVEVTKHYVAGSGPIAP
jgi:hypothetical protein